MSPSEVNHAENKADECTSGKHRGRPEEENGAFSCGRASVRELVRQPQRLVGLRAPQMGQMLCAGSLRWVYAAMFEAYVALRSICPPGYQGSGGDS